MSANSLHSFAFGIASKNSKAEIIEVYYPRPVLAPPPGLAELLFDNLPASSGENSVIELDVPVLASLQESMLGNGYSEDADLLKRLTKSKKPVIVCVLGKDTAPTNVAEAYLKLHLLSHRLCLPHSLNLDGMFGVLYNIAWTNQGAIDLDDLPDRQLQSRLEGELLEVMSIDKFPKMTNYVIPSGVRVAHSARVRLGAYLGEGTTIMHEGFVNFNAGTVGPAMIEGRISAGVLIGKNSDLGGGCSTMGTLSGGGSEIISVGANCLIGANAGIGFPLADNCTVEAGLYITAGTKVNVVNGETIKVVKAKELAQRSNLLFRRNSLTGAVECVPLKSAISLNEELHSHN